MKKALFAVVIILLAVPSSRAGFNAPSGVRTGPAESSCRIEWTPQPGAAGYNVYIQVEDGRFSRLNPKPLRDNFVRLKDLVNGKPYYFAVTSVDAQGEESSASATGMVVPTGFHYATIPVKGGRRAADYMLFSVPYNTGAKTVAELFPYLPAYDAGKWRIFSIENGAYREYADIGGIAPGKAFWFISAVRRELFFSGATVDNDKPFHLRLNPGWNLIGAPFLYPVDWKEALDKNPGLAPYLGKAVWEFNQGGFDKTGTLQPYRGYMVFSSLDTPADLLFPPVPATPKIYEELSPTSIPANMENGEWRMKLSATDGIYRDSDNYLGIDPGAENPDALNEAEPPAWPQHLSVYFVRKNDHETRRSSDVRAKSKNWTAVVEGGENRQVTLSWQVLSGKPDAVLLDVTANSRIDMGRQTHYTFTRKNLLPRKFIISARREQ